VTTPRATGPALVSLVGAGPGDPELLTLRALDRLRTADLVLYDGLTPRAIVDLAAGAECVSVARRVGRKTLTLDEVIAMMIAAARDGRRVVRLKSGDAFVFGRGGEEARGLADAGVPFEVVPGVTSAVAAPASAGIAVTYRGVASAFLVVSGHDADSYEAPLAHAQPGVTIVVLMGLGQREQIARTLVRHGWPATTPAAVIVNASRPDERTWTGTLATLGRTDGIASRDAPGVLVIGGVVSEAVTPNTANLRAYSAGGERLSGGGGAPPLLKKR
jgi:uroporphyrin-III C-methyltransferase/precorrin-2 dehydrogenase/sirohydrochlorin ferrochelatase